NDRRIISVTSQQFPGDGLPTVSGGAEVTAGTGIEQQNTFLAYFARATYSFADKYLLKASIRRDGSSRFGENVRFGNFPAISGGWIISEENFLNDSNTLSFLKIRASYGELGNAEIGNFASRFLFSSVPYNRRSGLAPLQPGNPNLTWEKSKQTDFGIDYGFLDGRISGEIDYYIKDTEGLLFEVPLVPSSGSNIINRNIGALRGKGFEFVLNTQNVSNDNFTWTTNFNISNNITELQSLPNDNADIVTGENINRVGETLASYYLREYAGVDPDNGDALYFLNDGTDGTTTDPNEAQRIAIGNPFPEWYGGLTNSMTYRGIDFAFTFQGERGASIYNSGGRFQSASADFYDNQSIDQLQRWQQPGDITDVPQARLFGANGTAESTRYLDEADFIRLRNLTLGYTIPSKTVEKIGFNKLRVYFTGINLLTFTDYRFEDPEARSDVNDNNNPGSTFYSSPPAKTFTIGLNINF
ncbi:MAG: SusC/RagA family TonB-linked outer membrane protein, partial [Pricia sp.]